MAALVVDVRVTDSEVFKAIVDLMGDVFRRSDGELKQHIKDELTSILGPTHDVEGILDGRYRRGN